jgi:hypothetical protein
MKWTKVVLESFSAIGVLICRDVVPQNDATFRYSSIHFLLDFDFLSSRGLITAIADITK